MPTFLGEVILCTKELNGETRVEAYNVLLGLGYHLQARTRATYRMLAPSLCYAHVVVVIIITCVHMQAHMRARTRATTHVAVHRHTYTHTHAHAHAHADTHRLQYSRLQSTVDGILQERPESGGARKLVEMAVAGLAGQV